MPKQVVPLSARRIDTTKPSDKEQTLFDGGGLYLLISPQKFSIEGKPLPSSRGWRFKYRFGGKPCKISFGVYPDVGLEEARRRREAARTMIAEGINPSQERQQRRIEERRELVIDGNTFERIARQWYSIAKPQWVAEHARTVLSRLERDILPELGHRLIAEIKTVDVLAVLRLVEERGAFETAHRIKSIITQIFSFAIVTAIPEVEINPAAGLSKALKQPIKKSMAAIIDPIVLGRLLVDIERYPGSLIVRCALQLAPRLFVRPGELRHAKWSDVDLDGAVWRLPIEEMKLTLKEKANRKGELHAVTLSHQAVDIFRHLHKYTGQSKYVFPGRAASRVISENTVNMALRTLGWDKETITGHGFRATARTLLHETLRFSPDAIEAQLAHRVPDRLGSAYNRTKHLDERQRMMQEWSDYLDRLREEASLDN